MTTIYTVSVKKKEPPKETLSYQPFITMLCPIHNTMETDNLAPQPTWDDAKHALNTNLVITRNNSTSYFCGIVETIQKGEHITRFTYVISSDLLTVYIVNRFNPES